MLSMRLKAVVIIVSMAVTAAATIAIIAGGLGLYNAGLLGLEWVAMALPLGAGAGVAAGLGLAGHLAGGSGSAGAT